MHAPGMGVTPAGHEPIEPDRPRDDMGSISDVAEGERGGAQEGDTAAVLARVRDDVIRELVTAETSGHGFPLFVTADCEPLGSIGFTISNEKGVMAMRDALAPHDPRGDERLTPKPKITVVFESHRGVDELVDVLLDGESVGFTTRRKILR